MASETSSGSPARTAAATAAAWFGKTGLRFALLAALLFVARVLNALFFGTFGAATGSGIEPVAQLPGMLAGSITYGAVLGLIALRSRLTGVRLALLVFSLVFGVTVVLAQVESVVFLQYLVSNMSTDMLTRVIVSATSYSVLCALLTSVVFAGHDVSSGDAPRRASLSVLGWTWRLVAIAVVYVLIYILAGLFIFRALAGPAFDEYYRDLQVPNWIVLFQFARAMIWVAVALPVIRLVNGGRWVVAVAVAATFSLLMSGFLLTPNSIMPDRIRLSHFVELTVSNGLFGLFVAWLLDKRATVPVTREAK